MIIVFALYIIINNNWEARFSAFTLIYCIICNSYCIYKCICVHRRDIFEENTSFHWWLITYGMSSIKHMLYYSFSIYYVFHLAYIIHLTYNILFIFWIIKCLLFYSKYNYIKIMLINIYCIKLCQCLVIAVYNV